MSFELFQLLRFPLQSDCTPILTSQFTSNRLSVVEQYNKRKLDGLGLILVLFFASKIVPNCHVKCDEVLKIAGAPVCKNLSKASNSNRSD